MNDDNEIRKKHLESHRIKKSENCESAGIRKESQEADKINSISQEDWRYFTDNQWQSSDMECNKESGIFKGTDSSEIFILDHGINPSQGRAFQEFQDYLDDLHQTEDGIDLGDFDCIQPYEVSEELCWCNYKGSIKELIQEAVNMDRMYLKVDRNNNITGFGFFDKGKNIEEYFALQELDYDFMKVDEPDWLSEGELENSLSDDLDYILSIRTKKVDLYVADLTELKEQFKKTIHETITRQIIHMEVCSKWFIIVVDVDDQYIIYKVFLQPDSSSYNNLKKLGWDVNPESVLHMIDYFIETGLTLHFYQ